MATTAFTDLSTLIVAAWLNDADMAAYAALTSMSGTNAQAGTGPASMTAYAAGQRFRFVPAGTNTGATTLNITPSGAAALGTKAVQWNAAALVGGEIRINVPVEVMYDGTAFQIVGSASMVQVKGATLTANRVPYAVGSSSLLQDSANLTFDGTTLTAHTAVVSTGTLTVTAGTVTSGTGTDLTLTSGATNGNVTLTSTGSGKVYMARDRALKFDNQTSSAGAGGGTLTNAPAAGNPGYWLKINIGGVDYAIPCWAG